MPADTVYVVDDDPSVRDAIGLLLSVHGLSAATFADAESFLDTVPAAATGCVIVDLRMPGLSGLELQRRLRAQAPGLGVVIVTAHGDVSAAREAFLGAAVDFIEKPFDPARLLAAVDRAMEAGRAAPPVAAASAPISPPRSPLSAREREVLSLLVKGLHNRRIAEELGISPRTVEVHKARVMEKLGARHVVDLVRLVDQGLAP
jgi:FixJ family two-component response regulator